MFRFKIGSPEKPGEFTINSDLHTRSLPKERHQPDNYLTVRHMSHSIRFFSFLVVAIAVVSPFLGPTLIKHGFPQSVLLVVGLGCGYLLGYLVSKQAGNVQERA